MYLLSAQENVDMLLGFVPGQRRVQKGLIATISWFIRTDADGCSQHLQKEIGAFIAIVDYLLKWRFMANGLCRNFHLAIRKGDRRGK
jgi:hypothetical protein